MVLLYIHTRDQVGSRWGCGVSCFSPEEDLWIGAHSQPWLGSLVEVSSSIQAGTFSVLVRLVCLGRRREPHGHLLRGMDPDTLA